VFVADHDEPLSEATLSLHLRRLVQAEIDRSFKLGLSGGGGRTRRDTAASDEVPDDGGATRRRKRRR
jgi:hypothetical protein